MFINRIATLLLFVALLAGCSHRAPNQASIRASDSSEASPPLLSAAAPKSAHSTLSSTAPKMLQAPPTKPLTTGPLQTRPSQPGVMAPKVRPIARAIRPNEVITVAAVGDLMFNDMEPRRGIYPLAGVAPVFRSVDVAFANLETPLTERGTPTPRKSAQQLAERKQWILRGSPIFARAVAASGLNVVSCANNHDMDWGPLGMLDTLQSLDAAAVRHTGAGINAATAHEPAILPVKGRRVAVLAYLAFQSEGGLDACTPSGRFSPGVAVIPAGDGGVSRAGMEVLQRDITHARTMADLVFVSFHWGIERQPLPTEYQRQLAHVAVDLGADMVLGGHPHVLEPLEQYRGAPIIYSLGNFVAPNSSGPLGETLILLTQWWGRRCLRIEVQPVRILNGQPVMLTGLDAAQASARFRFLCGMAPSAQRIARPQRANPRQL